MILPAIRFTFPQQTKARNMPNAYQPTVQLENLNPESFTAMKPGQWIKTPDGTRGQYLGVTASHTVIVRWATRAKFDTRAAHVNRTLRQYAKQHKAA